MGYNIKTLACPCKFKQIHDVNNWIATYIESFKFAQVTGWQIINNSSWVFKLLQWSTTVIENYNLSRKSDNWTPENAIHIILSRQHWDEADYESMEYLRQGLIANRFQVFLCWRIRMAIQQHPPSWVSKFLKCITAVTENYNSLYLDYGKGLSQHLSHKHWDKRIHNIIEQCAFVHVGYGISWLYFQGPHEQTHIV